MSIPSASAGASERRRHERKALHGTAYLQFPGHPPIPARIVDLSLGGIGVIAPVNPPAKATCTIGFGVPTQPNGMMRVEASATVLHSVFGSREDAFKIGLQFNKLSDAALKSISRYLSTAS